MGLGTPNPNMENSVLSENVVEARDLTKMFSKNVALRSLNTQLLRGTIFGFVNL
jgi:ABC-type transporter Mla maintaining outer membrane lipid asymmetry ATPase subunit MlaF